MTGSLPSAPAARRRLGYLPQEVGFPRRSTAFGFLDYVAVLKEWTDTRARHREVLRVLDLVDLGGLGSKRVSALSGGQRRRLAIAQALMGDPTLVVLDEPTTGLDPEQRASLRGLLSEQARTSGVLLATHQTEDVVRAVRPGHRPRRRRRLLRRHRPRPRRHRRRPGLGRQRAQRRSAQLLADRLGRGPLDRRHSPARRPRRRAGGGGRVSPHARNHPPTRRSRPMSQTTSRPTYAGAALGARHAGPARDRCAYLQAPAVPRRPRADRRRCVLGPDKTSSSLFHVIVPATAPRRLRPAGDGRPGPPLRPGARGGRHGRGQRARPAPTRWPRGRGAVHRRAGVLRLGGVGLPRPPAAGLHHPVRRGRRRLGLLHPVRPGRPSPRSAARSSAWSSPATCGSVAPRSSPRSRWSWSRS